MASYRTPRTVEEITKAAQSYEYSAMVPLRSWLRTANTMLKEAEIYESEGDDEQAYLLLFRHAHLVLTNLSKHPNTDDLKEAKRVAQLNLSRLEQLNPRIKRRYARHQEILGLREAQRLARLEVEESLAVPENDQVLATENQELAVETQEMAVQVAQEQISRRARRRFDQPQTSVVSSRSSCPSSKSSFPSSLSYSYPTVPVEARSSESRVEPKLTYSGRVGTLTPSLPPKPPKVVSTPPPSSPPYTFKPSSYLESGKPLRTLFLPPTLRASFLTLALSNTARNLETCAFLAGTLISNALFVSRLVVPRQTATSDTCEMTHESDLFDYIDSSPDLMILGWIHTHPTQTCFMSSRDLHTHAAYQVMLQESVAIVCAPSKGDVAAGGEWGIYRLTDPPGREIILKCQKPGVFHPHEQGQLYTDALPGHVVETKGLEFEVVDLRVEH